MASEWLKQRRYQLLTGYGETGTLPCCWQEYKFYIYVDRLAIIYYGNNLLYIVVMTEISTPNIDSREIHFITLSCT